MTDSNRIKTHQMLNQSNVMDNNNIEENFSKRDNYNENNTYRIAKERRKSGVLYVSQKHGSIGNNFVNIGKKADKHDSNLEENLPRQKSIRNAEEMEEDASKFIY